MIKAIVINENDMVNKIHLEQYDIVFKRTGKGTVTIKPIDNIKEKLYGDNKHEKINFSLS